MFAVTASCLHRPRARTCIIGAGASGLVACRALKRRGLLFDCFESGEGVGGLWLFKNQNGRGGAYRSLRINTSRDRSSFAEFPMPGDYPDYPGHELIARYFESYARQFELHRDIRFRTRVASISPRGKAFEVTLGDGRCERYDAVIVANGHHFEPRFPPAVPGNFSGQSLHAGAYVDPREPLELAGKRVVVVGFGNSAVDIASELASAGSQVFLSVRRGAWVLPRYAFGRPLDQVSSSSSVLGWLPRAARRGLVRLWYQRTIGRPERFGLPRPDHEIGDAHPTVSDELLPLLTSGRIQARGAIERFDRDEVFFVDGSHATADAIVYATGYRVDFPFFEPDFISAPDNELPLFLRVFHPARPGIYFVGLCQPLGPLFPLAEAQARLIAAHLAGDYALPPAAAMARAAQEERDGVRRRYGSSPRHTMQLDFDAYLHALAKEEAAGVRRARACRERPSV
jgi:dimethylaniline monooxygenase (N-oxide forming)